VLRAGTIYLALGSHHIGIRKGLSGPILFLDDSPPVSDHRPSVDYLFNSAAKYLSGVRIFAVLLTGMGRDGAQGLKNLLDHGAFTAVQDQDSCVVYGMPKEAVRLGAAVLVGPVQEIRGWLEYASGITKVLKKAS
jgi:two-component system chemotaxis response regulator CheB